MPFWDAVRFGILSVHRKLESKVLTCLMPGFMGTAILQGLLRRQELSDWHYTACVRSATSSQRLQRGIEGHADRVSVGCNEAVPSAVENADVVLLGCAPGDLEAMLQAAGLASGLQGKLVVSLLAGVSTSHLQEALRRHATEDCRSAISSPEGASAPSVPQPTFRVARVIPSIGAKIGDSVTLLAESAELRQSDAQRVRGIFSHIGSVIGVPESLMDAATAVGAVCHALVIQAADALTDASVAEGIPRANAVSLAAQTLRSASNLLCSDDASPEQLKTAMSTPQGITINSILQLQQDAVPHGIAAATRKAIQYAKGMS